ncbi:glutathione binding-like protein [Ignatzschineria sp. LJL83]
MLTLYYTKGSCAEVVLTMANALEIELNVVNVNISQPVPKLEDGTNFYRINPKGYVPALQLENGEIITEVVAICAYLSELKPGNTLFPLSGKGLIDQIQWFNFIATEIHKNFMPFFFRLFGKETGDEWIKVSSSILSARYEYLDNLLANQPFLTGNTMTSADIYLNLTLTWAKVVSVDLREFTHLTQYRARMKEAL